MQKIRTQEEIEYREKRNKRIFTFIMLSVLMLGTIGYGFSLYSENQPEKQTNSNQSKAINVGNQWAIQYGGQDLYLKSSPESVQDVPVEINTNLNKYYQQPLYIVSDSEDISYEIYSTLGRYASRYQLACYEKCDKNLPEKSCDENLIVWNTSQINKVYQNDSCVFIEGDIKAVDAFLYKIFGIN